MQRNGKLIALLFNYLRTWRWKDYMFMKPSHRILIKIYVFYFSSTNQREILFGRFLIKMKIYKIFLGVDLGSQPWEYGPYIHQVKKNFFKCTNIFYQKLKIQDKMCFFPTWNSLSITKYDGPIQCFKKIVKVKKMVEKETCFRSI